MDGNRKIHVLVVDDEEIVRESLLGWLEKDGYTVDTAPDGRTALDRIGKEPWAIMLLDLKMPGMDGMQVLEETKKLRPETVVVIMTAYAAVDTAVTAMKIGAYDYLVKPFDPEELSLLITKIVAQQALVQENVLLRKVLKREYRFHDFMSKSPAMQQVFELARAAAKTPSTVLIQGESGTGKEVLARAIHAESPRSHGPFVAVSCAALAETLLESELFGHEKGAFTGAVVRRKGKFEQANGGTLFLDEIGDVSPKLQLDLLRALEARAFDRLGGSEAVQVDVRIVAATNRDLKKAVEAGHFREDLYYRLNVIPVTIPPLRERREDIPLLVDHITEQLGVEMGRAVAGVSPDAMSVLMAYAWPGNVRELRNVLERAVVVAGGRTLEAADLGLGNGRSNHAPADDEALTLEDVERRHIADVMRRSSGNVSQAARVLGIDRVTLYNKLKRYQLRRNGDDNGGEQC